jgi:16S rRNA (uracil1498-N3)-methyltransferase
LLAPAGAHVFVGDLDTPSLEPNDVHHLTRVLRLRVGETVTAGDGHGRWRRCLWLAGRLRIDGPIEIESPRRPAVTVAFAPVKGDRPEWTVQKLTELGVDRIVPFLATRSVVRWDGERARHQAQRWRRVAREAAMQARLAWLPEVSDLAGFAEVAQLPGAALAVVGGGAPTLASPTVLVGPEGGWDASELDAGLPRVGLGPTILRAETAALTAGCLLCALREGTVRPR